MNPEEQINNDLSQRIMVLRIIHLAMAGGLILFGGVSLYLSQNGGLPEPALELHQIFRIATALLFVGGLIAGHFLLQLHLKQISAMSSLESKLLKLQSGLIIRAAMIEGPSLFAGVAYYLIQQIEYLGVLAIGTVLLIVLIPNKDTIKKIVGTMH